MAEWGRGWDSRTLQTNTFQSNCDIMGEKQNGRSTVCPVAALALMGWVDLLHRKCSCSLSLSLQVYQQPFPPDFGLDRFTHLPKPNTTLSYPPPFCSNTSRDLCIFCFFGTSNMVGKYFKILETITQNIPLPLSEVMFWNITLYASYVISVSEFIVSDKELSHWNNPFH